MPKSNSTSCPIEGFDRDDSILRRGVTLDAQITVSIPTRPSVEPVTAVSTNKIRIKEVSHFPKDATALEGKLKGYGGPTVEQNISLVIQ